jgi:hypothetical protein
MESQKESQGENDDLGLSPDVMLGAYKKPIRIATVQTPFARRFNLP